MGWAVGLAGAFGVEVVAVHAIGLLDSVHDRAERDAAAGSWRDARRDDVERWCAPLADSPVKHRIEVHDGRPVDVLLAAADRERAALVVVGSRGLGANPALALGSTSLQVLRTARRPVLVVPDDGSADGSGVQRMLVGVDRSAASLAALGLAADFASALGASLRVVEVVEEAATFPLGPETTASAAGEEHALDQEAGVLESHVTDIRDRGVDVDVIVWSGEPALTLLELSDELDADVVVVGTRGHGEPIEPVTGSVARAVADRGRRPTLVVPAPGDAA